MAAALGATVEPNPRGFEIGAAAFDVSEAAQRYFAETLRLPLPAPALRMFYVHGDWVVPGTEPAELANMGGTQLSPVNGLFNGDNLLTFQGHPEFSAAVVDGLIPVLAERGHLPARLPPAAGGLEGVRASLTECVDAPWLREAMLSFLLGGASHSR